ncbi:MAG: AAA family ATPase [Candidatus Angelobacter sp.]
MSLAQLKQKWGIRSPADLKRRCKEIGGDGYIIDRWLPQGSIGIVVGDSGLGKSPLLYQLAVCVAAGIPFLGRAVLKGTVVFLDFEYGISLVDEIIATQSRYLGVQEPPDDLLLWNANDTPAKWDGTCLGFLELIKELQPTLVIIDSLNVFKPEAEEKASIAARFYKDLRALIRGQADVLCAAFYVAEIGPVNPKAVCHFLLRPAPRKPQLADSLAKTCLKRLRHIS